MTGIGNVGRVVIGLTLMVAAACGESPTEPQFPYVEGDPAVRRIEWAARGLTDYDYRLSYSNEWIDVPAVRVEIRGGAVVRLVELDGGAVITGADHPCWRTIDDLYDEAVAAYVEPENVVFLTYDRKLDYVRAIRVDVANWADDAWGYAASHLVVR